MKKFDSTESSYQIDEYIFNFILILSPCFCVVFMINKCYNALNNHLYD